MLIYNVTIKVDHRIKDQWLDWLRDMHIPEMIGTGCFTSATILWLMESDDNEGATFAVQYSTSSKAMYDHYIEKFSDEMRKKGIEKWGDKFIAFRTLMQVVD